MIGIPLPRRHGDRQPREQAVPCQMCGYYQDRPRTMTWNRSALCDGHEAGAEQIRRAAVESFVLRGYSRQIAEQIVTRAGAR
jgi:hypothetical protein